MMSIEGPFLAAVIARLPEPIFNLAAFGVAFSFATIAEAPIIMILSASTALVKDLDSYRRLRNFSFALNLTVTIVILVGLFPRYSTGLRRISSGFPTRLPSSRTARFCCSRPGPRPSAIAVSTRVS